MVGHLLDLKELAKEEILGIVDTALEIKKNPSKFEEALEGKTLVMLFQKTSTRTRLSFEIGMQQLGGKAVFLDWKSTQFAMSDIRDETQVLCRYADIIMARLIKNSDLLKMAKASSVPVINGCDEKHHPCQILCDLVTIKEKFGKLEGLKLVYVGIHNNTCNSLIEGCTKVGMKITTVTPITNEPSIDLEIVESAKNTGLYESTLDLKSAMEGADIVYTDTWVDMEFFFDSKFMDEKEKRLKQMMPYQINEALLSQSTAMVMHLMPIHEGYEITREIVNGEKSMIFDQAENRLHGQKAILLFLLNSAKASQLQAAHKQLVS